MRRAGGDPFHAAPELIGEMMFGGTRLDLDNEDTEDTLAAVRRWAPDLVVAEAFDTVGPFVAAHLKVPWHERTSHQPGARSITSTPW